MNNPESLSRLSIFRSLGKYLCQRWGLGLQLAGKKEVSRPIAVGKDSALSAYLAAALTRAELRSEHQNALAAIGTSNEAQIVEHPSGFQMLAVPCALPTGRHQLVISPLAVAEELTERRDRVYRHLTKAGVTTREAKSASNALQAVDRRDLEHVAALGGLLADEAIEWARNEAESERRLDNLRKKKRTRYHRLVGNSIAIQEMFSLLDRITESESTIYIYGENGTGKELVAREIHEHSRRQNGPFVAQNCSALNDNLLESEIFGHKRGAFTGAVHDKPGLFELADGGTFFLDEIGDMSPALQVKLLRVLQEGTFMPVGDVAARKVDVRILCATNRNLFQMVKDGRFREDLYYRINVINIRVPALRERPDDIPLLTEYFLAVSAERSGGPGTKKKLSKHALARMLEYGWPGNVRELQNEIERLVVLSGTLATTIGEELLSPRIRHRPLQLANQQANNHSLPDALEQLEREMIYEHLRRNRWNKTKTATALGISRRNLIRKVERYGFDRRSG